MPAVTAAMEDYLTAIYRLRESGVTVTTQLLAGELCVTGASVTGMIKRLGESGLVHHVRYHSVDLTEQGEHLALSVLRRHRLIEQFLVVTLGYPWDTVHVEADRLEHHVSTELEARLDAALGYPKHDPHGDPIPDQDGHLEEGPTRLLVDLEPGDRASIVRVAHRDAERLRYLAELGLRPGVAVTFVERLPFGGPLRLLIEDNECLVGGPLAQGLYVGRLQIVDPNL